ncbi:PsbP domain-containing protein, partial [Haematococcus lacustris]
FYNTADHADNLYLPKRIVLLAFPLTLQAARSGEMLVLWCRGVEVSSTSKVLLDPERYFPAHAHVEMEALHGCGSLMLGSYRTTHCSLAGNDLPLCISESPPRACQSSYASCSFRHQLAHASTPAAPSTLPISEASEDQAVAAQSPAADPAAAGAATSPNTASSSGAATPPGQLFEDEEYTYTAPATFTFVDIPIPKIERGPAPERSPLRSRFEAGDGGQASLAVVVRNAQTLSFSLL